MDSAAVRQGIYFGINSGVITTIGLINGLVQSNINRHLLIISVVSLAISDGISEAYSIYLSKKAENINDQSKAPLYSFMTLLVSKFLVVVSFLIPMVFTKSLRIYKNMSWVLIWGFFLTILFDYRLSKLRSEPLVSYLVPHSLIIILVIILTKFFGMFIEKHS
jgi:vacuolar iron transporter family protein